MKISINITLGLIIIFFVFSLFYTAIDTRKKIPIVVNVLLLILIMGICIWLNILNAWIAIGALITFTAFIILFKKLGKK
ncbi:hypothetical protein C2I27_18255 [Priestia megaterium]|nr:hypothetical protein C2I27_18255 [Priestia megaterium]